MTDDDVEVAVGPQAGVAARVPEAALEPAGFELPRRRVWPIFVVLAGVLLGGAWLVWRSLSQPLPTRVLIAVDIDGQWWEGSEQAAQLADRLGKRLEELGFDVVRAGAPETLQELEDADSVMAAAMALRAAFVIEGEATPELLALPIEGGFFEGRLRGELRVHHLGDDKAVLVLPLRGYVGAKERAVAQGLVVAQLARLALNAVPPALVKHPSIDAIINGNDARMIDRLNPAKQFVLAYDREMARAKAAYADLDQQRRAAEKGGRALHFISPPDAEDRLIATGKWGALLSTAPVTPYYQPSDGALLRYQQLETVEWRNDAGAVRRLWEGYNLFTYPSVAQAGQQLVLVEDLFGWARTLAVTSHDTPLNRLRVDPARKFSQPRISPTGRWIAYIDKSCRRCTREVAVMDARAKEHTEQLRLTAPRYRSIGDYAWLGERTLMIIARAQDVDDDEGYGLWAFDAASGERSSLLVGRGASLGTPVATHNGATIAVAHINGGTIVVMDTQDKAMRTHRVGGQATSLSFSPNGRWVTFELLDKRYRDIAALNVKTGKVVRLTNNDAPDRFPQFSADNKRVYFEARNTDPLFGKVRAVVRVAWVAMDDE